MSGVALPEAASRSSTLVPDESRARTRALSRLRIAVCMGVEHPAASRAAASGRNVFVFIGSF
jgi:hypothetical protein